MSRPALVRQADITRAIRAAKAQGLAVAGVELQPDGSVRVLTNEPQARPLSALEAWRVKQGGDRAA